MNSNLRVIPLGGLGEIGKNMMALEYGDDIIVVDCGVQFPEEDQFGVDLIIPDVRYLVERKDRVRGILITHGHEDHIGALPYVLPQLDVPVYAPQLAHGLISVKMRAALRPLLNAIEPGQSYQFGQNFKATWFRVCHSIPDAMGVAIETPLGVVIHTGDFKIDHTPADGRTIDLHALAKWGEQGVLLLCSDSTYANVPGYTASEQVVGVALERAIAEARGRVMVATFASLISRVQQVVNAAERHNRKVGIVGRSMIDNVNMAAAMGYLRLPPGLLRPLNELRRLPPEELVLMTTGSQGEPTSALVRISNRDHRDVRIEEGDTVVISASPIPGNELLVSRTVNNLLRQKARVLYDPISLVHVHGHASQEELKLMLRLTRPRYFVPVHGEYRHLTAHAQLAWDLKVAEGGIFILDDGDVLELSAAEGKVTDKIPVGPILLDSGSAHEPDSQVLRDRRALSRDGVVVVAVAADPATGRLTAAPRVVASGFMDNSDASPLLAELAAFVAQRLNNGAGEAEAELPLLRSKTRDAAREFLAKNANRRPMIIPVVVEQEQCR